MKSSFRIPALLLILILGFSTLSQAQLRDNVQTRDRLTGTILKDREPGTLENLFNMQMDHSYSMMFSSFGGEYRNVNAYTNTMQFFFTDRLTGRVDLSLLHSPFSNNGMIGNNSGLGADFVLRNAELNYQLSDKSSIHLQFQQIPAGMGYGSYYSNPFHSSPFNRGPFNYGNY